MTELRQQDGQLYLHVTGNNDDDDDGRVMVIFLYYNTHDCCTLL